MAKSNAKLKKVLIPAEPAKAAPVVATAPKATSMPGASSPAPAASVPVVKVAPTANRVALTLVKPGAQKVFVAGSFNQWQPEKTPLARGSDGRWVGSLALPPGRHEYLFVVDGEWVPDPCAKETVANPFGGLNSVLVASE